MKNLELFKNGYSFEPYHYNKASKDRLRTANPTGCSANSFKRYYYRVFFNQEYIEKILNEWATKKDYALNFLASRKPISFCLYPDGLAVSTNEFKEALMKGFHEHIEGYADSNKIKTQLLKEIGKLEKKLRKRAREPVSFWETLAGAFLDLFR